MMISKRSSLKLLGITLLLMLIPLMANWLNNEFHWKFGDFILMGAMIYGLGLISLILMNVAKNKILRWIVTGLFFLLFIIDLGRTGCWDFRYSFWGELIN